MKEKRYSEDPIKDIWMGLLKYSYSSNIKRSTKITDEDLINSISGSIVQSYEYFMASQKSSLNISPLLMYYGCVNLLFAIGQITKERKIEIANHGASITVCNDNIFIGNTQVHLSSSSDGAFYIFNSIFSENTQFPKVWELMDVFGFIPELKNEYEECYLEKCSSCVPVEVIKRSTDKLERIKKTNLKKEFDELNISNFKNAYLPHQETNEYIILREKLKSIDIGTYSISGEKNLIYLVESEGKKYYMNQVMAIFTGLYSLSVFSRYHPNIWYPFVQKDETGERGLIESFLSIAYRKLPNLALNIVLDREIVFVNNSLGSIDTSQQYNTEDIKKLIHEETNK